MSGGRPRGFTLVEALASLTILGMVSLMLFNGIGAGQRVWDAVQRRDDAGLSVETAQTIVRERVEHAAATFRYDGARPYADFRGESSSVGFLAPPRPAEARLALARYGLSLNASGELTLAGTDGLSLRPGGSAVVLLTGVRAIDLAYFGPAAPTFEPAWRDSWRFQASLPTLVRIRVAFPPGDRRLWPDLIVRVPASTGLRCSPFGRAQACESGA